MLNLTAVFPIIKLIMYFKVYLLLCKITKLNLETNSIQMILSYINYFIKKKSYIDYEFTTKLIEW